MKKTYIVLGVVVVALVALGAWSMSQNASAPAPVADNETGGNTESANTPPAPAPETKPVPPPSPTPKPVVKPPTGTPVLREFTVKGQNFSFSPSALAVKKGDRVRITFENSGGTHDLRIDEFGVATSKIGTGAKEVVEFTADKIGAFQYYCSVGSHRAMGMWGTLTVAEQL